MLKLDLIKTQVQDLLDNNILSSRILLDRMRVLDEASRKSASYSDPKYCMFYYHLGKVLQPQSMLEIGVSLGLLSSCFLKSCKSVRRYLGFQEQSTEYYSPRLGLANIRDNYKGTEAEIYVGKVTDDELSQKISPNSWDLVILNIEAGFDKHLMYLDLIWPYMSENGIIVSEYIGRHTPAREALTAFCGSKNRVSVIFNTRYGTGLVQK